MGVLSRGFPSDLLRMGFPNMAPVQIGDAVTIEPTARVGCGPDQEAVTRIGDEGVIKAGAIVYGDVTVGNGLVLGHHTLIREDTEIGHDVSIGPHVVIDGRTTIGSTVTIEGGAYVPQETSIGDRVFIGPGATLTNDPYPVRTASPLHGPVIDRGVSIGANATVLPGVTIGERSFVAAGTVVTGDVPPYRLAMGVPARIHPLPEPLRGVNVPR